MRTNVLLAACVTLAACGTETEIVDETEQATTRWSPIPGEEQQGTMVLGEADATERGVRTTGTVGAATLSNLFVDRGELVGWRTDGPGAVPVLVRGPALAGALLVVDTDRGSVPFFVGGVRRGNVAASGVPVPDPTGDTWLYTLFSATSQKPLCKADRFGRIEAIPVGARWNAQGDRVERSAADLRFSFACLSGVVAKCYMWGYRPWETGYLRDVHQTCTRAARADYCGDGVTHTCPGTPINLFDLPAGYIPRYALAGFKFEAGWTAQGARCLSKNRWDALPASPLCTDFARRGGPHDAQGNRVICDSVETVQLRFPEVSLFTDSQLRPWPMDCSSLP